MGKAKRDRTKILLDERAWREMELCLRYKELTSRPANRTSADRPEGKILLPDRQVLKVR